MSAEGKLSAQQKRFVLEYIVDLNATQAAIRAGYSEKTAKQQGSRLLTNVDVASAVAAAQAKIAKKLEITAERVLNELALIGFSNMMNYIQTTEDGSAFTDLSALTRDQAAAIQEITVDTYTDNETDGDGKKRTVKKMRFKLADKRAALVDIGKHIGMFREQVDLNINDGLAGLLENARRRATEARLN